MKENNSINAKNLIHAFIPCDENDKDRSGFYTSNDGQSLGHVKQVIVASTESNDMNVLIELVECKNLNAESQSYMKTDDYYAYLRRFEAAWEAARKLIESRKNKI